MRVRTKPKANDIKFKIFKITVCLLHGDPFHLVSELILGPENPLLCQRLERSENSRVMQNGFNFNIMLANHLMYNAGLFYWNH